MFGAKVKQLARYTEETDWTAYNPSICYTEEHGYLITLRSSNGFLKDHREEWQAPLGEELNTPDCFEEPSQWYQSAYINAQYGSEKLFRNRLFIANFNPKTQNISFLREVDLTEAYEKAPFKIKRGIEDARLFHDGKTLKISAVLAEIDAVDCARICEIELDVDDTSARGVSFKFFDSPVSEDTVEKNWMPVHRTSLVNSDEVTFDYIYAPTKTYTTEDNKLHDVGGFGEDYPIRGGSQLIGLENGTMLAIIHQCVTVDVIRFASITKPSLFRRRYTHRFVQYNSDGQIIQVTDKFNFLNKSIEFAAGMAIKDNKVLITFGALDSSAHLASIPLKNILSALRPPVIST